MAAGGWSFSTPAANFSILVIVFYHFNPDNSVNPANPVPEGDLTKAAGVGPYSTPAANFIIFVIVSYPFNPANPVQLLM